MVWGSGLKKSTPTQRIRDESNPDGEPTFALPVRQLESAFALFLPVLRQVAAKAKVVQERFLFSEKVKLTPGILNEKPINSRYTGKFTFLETKVMQILVQMIVLVQLV